jgi:hypothetical protein
MIYHLYFIIYRGEKLQYRICLSSPSGDAGLRRAQNPTATRHRGSTTGTAACWPERPTEPSHRADAHARTRPLRRDLRDMVEPLLHSAVLPPAPLPHSAPLTRPPYAGCHVHIQCRCAVGEAPPFPVPTHGTTIHRHITSATRSSATSQFQTRQAAGRWH